MHRVESEDPAGARRRSNFMIFLRGSIVGALIASAAGLRLFAQSLPAALTASLHFPAPAVVVSTEHFQLISQDDAPWSSAIGTRLESLYRSFYLDLSSAGFKLNSPDAPMTWICFGDHAAFNGYARQIDQFDAYWLSEYYSPKTNRVALLRENRAAVVNVSRTASSIPEVDLPWIAHEEAHQLSFSSGLLKAGVMIPVWVSEGIATSFESGRLAGIHSVESNPSRTRGLADAFDRGRLLPLDRFVVMPRFRPDEGYDLGDAYAESEGLFQFLLTRRPEGLRNYLSALASLDPGDRSGPEMLSEFQSAFGSVESLAPAWTAYLQELSRLQSRK